MTLWPRQVEILTAMCEGRDYPFPGATALDRAKRKYAALNKLRALGYVSGSEITLKGRLALSAHLEGGSGQVHELVKLLGSSRKIADIVGVHPSTISRVRGYLPDEYRERLIDWSVREGMWAEISRILG